MKRTTIFRSSLAVLALCIAAPVAPAAAQDTLQAPAGRQAVRHVVREGETLWAIAQLYLGDPFLWPEIYRLNTLVVEDPHWIFPGEELRLVPPDTTMVAAAPPAQQPQQPVAAAPVTGQEQGQERPPVEAPQVEAPAAPPPPPPAAQMGPTVFAQTQRQRAASQLLPFAGSVAPRAVRRGDFYAAGFLTEGQQLPWAEVRGAVEAGRLVRDRNHISSAMVFETVRIRAPQGATYQIGDSLLTARLAREMPSWGQVVVPTGIVRVTHVSGREILADVITQFGRVTDGQVAMPIEPFRNPGTAMAQPVAQGVSGRVITVRDQHPVPGQLDVVFVDLGRQDGLVPGDVFEVIRAPEQGMLSDQPPERLALVQIVHVRDRSAAGILTHIFEPGTRSGVPVRMVRKMP